MKLVMTLLARNEADLVDANVAFHLNAGADLVVATDNQSEDGTTEILESYAREGHVHLLREAGTDMRQGEWVTRMARIAAEHGADWVIHGDADEFYWPRGGTLKEVLAAVPARFGTLRTFVRTFLLRPGDGFFAERMTVRLSAAAPINDPASIFRPGSKVVHRADPNATLGDGTHTLHGTSLRGLRGLHPIELLHFPFRTAWQTEQKFLRAWRAWSANPLRPPPHYYAKGRSAIQAGRFDEYLASLAVDGGTLERGLADGSLVVDTRLRDALRELRIADEGERRFRVPPAGPPLSIPEPDLDEQVRYGAETAAFVEGDLVRLQRRIDQVEARIGSLEGGAGAGNSRAGSVA